MMRVEWFKNPENVVYADANEFMENFGKEIGISNLRNRVEQFCLSPTKEGETIHGKKRTSITIFIPDLTFEEHIEMGENPWIYMGESYEAYCIYNL